MTPDEIRAVFSQNLKALMGPGANVSELARQIGVNRTQFNRYLYGESWPRPDVLQRICEHFGVDARILTTPLSSLRLEDCLMKVGDRVQVRMPNLPDCLGVVVAGPEFHQGKVALKVEHDGFDNWYPVEWLTPAIRPVSDSEKGEE